MLLNQKSLSMANTNTPTNHLTTLPPELLQTIASYLYATHVPNKAVLELRRKPCEPPLSLLHPDLPSLSLASKLLHAQTNAWAHHFLLHHRPITKYRTYKTAKAAAKQPSPLATLLKWTAHACVFCGKKSSPPRSAILMNGLRCCKKCDDSEWPHKITSVEAEKKYKIVTTTIPKRTRERLELPFVELRLGTFALRGPARRGMHGAMYLRRDVVAFRAVNALVFDREARKRFTAKKAMESYREMEREAALRRSAEVGAARGVDDGEVVDRA